MSATQSHNYRFLNQSLLQEQPDNGAQTNTTYQCSYQEILGFVATNVIHQNPDHTWN